MFINTPPWRKVAREFSTLLYVSNFPSFICLWILILWKNSIGFEDENKTGTAKASFRISFLCMSFMYRAAHPEPPQASRERRNSACLMLHLLVIYEGSSTAVLFKCQVVGQKSSFWFTQGHCRLLAGTLLAWSSVLLLVLVVELYCCSVNVALTVYTETVIFFRRLPWVTK